MKKVEKNLKRLDKNGKTIFWTVTCLLLFAVSSYIYFVNTAAMNGVRYGKIEQDMVAIGASVSDLESRYLSLQESVTLPLAYSRGFEDVRAVTFISAKTVGTVARGNEI